MKSVENLYQKINMNVKAKQKILLNQKNHSKIIKFNSTANKVLQVFLKILISKVTKVLLLWQIN